MVQLSARGGLPTQWQKWVVETGRIRIVEQTSAFAGRVCYLGVGELRGAMSVFKFFSEKSHAKAFMAGRLLLRSLSHFRALEAEEGGRGDGQDGVLTYAMGGGLPLTFSDGRTETFDGSFIAVPRHAIFVLCGSNQLSPHLAERFGGFCVEVDPDVLTARLRQRANATAQFEYEQIVSSNVDYRANHRPPGGDWALPERLALTKPESFAWQDEYRIAVPTRGAFAVEAVDLLLHSDDEPPPIPKVAAPPVILRVGNLANHAVLHQL